MAGNHVLLETIALTQSAASVTFDNIPQSGYTDLKLVMSARGASDVTDTRIRFNGSSTNASDRWLYGDGSAAASTTNSVIDVPVNRSSYTANTYSNSEIYIPNYLSTTTAKSVSYNTVTENNATAVLSVLGAGLWNPVTQAAITSITILMASGDIAANSTFSLYGIAATGTTPAVAPKATGGNIVETDGTYWYHTFLTSGTFVPQTSLTCDYLVIAGGGGGAGVSSGGSYSAPGGGAGGYRTSVGTSGGGASAENALSLQTQIYPVLIGAGGAANITGSNSIFSTITSNGGGGAPNLSGGSGAGAFNFGTLTPGNGTTNQGYAGGAASSNTSAGGGGGAGGAGSSARTGGAGITSSISGSSVARAGGGGAGWGGTASAGGGAGGSSSANSNGTAGTAYTGGGGGGGTANNGTGYGGAGGSGVVIIRYAMV